MFNMKINKMMLIKDWYASIMYNLLINNMMFQRTSLEISQSYATGRTPKNNMTKLNNKKYGQLNHTRMYHTDKMNNSYFNMKEWLVGMTDGDGTFNVYTNMENKKIIFTYKISLTNKNMELLYKIKEYLGIGTINMDKNMVSYLIRDKKDLMNIVMPIFDKYPLLTSKRFNYLKFKECLMISNNNMIHQVDKINIINNIKNRSMNENYMSDVWENIMLTENMLLNRLDSNLLMDYPMQKTMGENKQFISKINNIMTKSWIIGFIEAEGSFFITKKTTSRYVHSFGVTQKLDPIILLSMKYLWDINSSVQLRNPKNSQGTYYKLETTNTKNIETIIKYFRYSNYKSVFLGMKSFEYRIWTRTYLKYKNDPIKLMEAQNLMRRYRKNMNTK
uniref:Maturase n=1 Tax=Monosporozyma servazzii TaxID=27293 RepID=Q7YEU5_MONSE|nr:maturase [Kazachstania servazzii]CAD23428.1 maturase [Kazachstania servazzii]